MLLKFRGKKEWIKKKKKDPDSSAWLISYTLTAKYSQSTAMGAVATQEADSLVEEIGRTEKSVLKLKAKSANSKAALCKYRMFSFPFSTMRHFFYSLLFWSQTNVLHSQSPNCCGLLLIYISSEWAVIQIV